jgi:hypothetical protein
MQRSIQPTPHPSNRHDDRFELDALLHPAGAFAHPMNVVEDPDLTLNEKRAILSSWASDVCAVEEALDLRQPHGGTAPVRFDDVMDALRILEREAAAGEVRRPHYRRVLAKRVPGVFGRKESDGESNDRGQGPMLS